MYRSTLVPALIAGALLLTACGADDATRTASTAGTGSATSSAPSSAPLSAPSSAPADGANEEADDDEQPPAGTTPEPTPSPTPGPAAPGTPAPGTAAPSAPGEHAPQDVPPGTGRPDGYPTEVVSSHGAQLWGVYLAAGAADDVWQAHAVGEAEGFLTGQGFTGSGIGSVSCDQGAAEQLGLAPEHDRVAVYFATAEQAQQFVDVYERDTLGTALVTTYCLD